MSVEIPRFQRRQRHRDYIIAFPFFLIFKEELSGIHLSVLFDVKSYKSLPLTIVQYVSVLKIIERSIFFARNHRRSHCASNWGIKLFWNLQFYT